MHEHTANTQASQLAAEDKDFPGGMTLELVFDDGYVMPLQVLDYDYRAQYVQVNLQPFQSEGQGLLSHVALEVYRQRRQRCEPRGEVH